MSPSVSENVESNETIEAVLDRTGDVQSSLSLQETTRWAIKRKILYLMPWHTPYNGDVITHTKESDSLVGQDQNHTVLDVAIRMIWRLEEPVCFGTKVRVRLSVN